jgi:hypothetical protein
MLSATLPKKLVQVSLLGSLGILAIGIQSASAITLTLPGLSGSLEKNCDSKVPLGSPCSLSFNYFDDPSTWITLTNDRGGQETWAVKGTVIAATANLSDSITGEGVGAKVLTLTAAEFAYKSGDASVGSFNGLTFSNFFDFTTSTRAGTVLYSNPTFHHRLSGSLSSANSTLNNNDRVQSAVSFDGKGNTISSTTLSADQTRGLTNDLSADSWRSGRPFGSNFSFAASNDENLSTLPQAPFYLKEGTISTTLWNISLAKGDTLYLPASDCVIVSQRELVKEEVVKKVGGASRKEVTGVNFLDGNGEAIVTKKKDASGKFQLEADRSEELCSKVARSVVPEPNSAFPVLGGLIMWGAGILMRKRH